MRHFSFIKNRSIRTAQRYDKFSRNLITEIKRNCQQRNLQISPYLHTLHKRTALYELSAVQYSAVPCVHFFETWRFNEYKALFFFSSKTDSKKNNTKIERIFEKIYFREIFLTVARKKCKNEWMQKVKTYKLAPQSFDRF